MKTFLKLAILFIVAFGISSCRTSNDHKYKQFYKSINKGYDQHRKKLAEADKKKKKKVEVNTDPCCNQGGGMYAAYLDSIAKNLGAIVVALGTTDSNELSINNHASSAKKIVGTSGQSAQRSQMSDGTVFDPQAGAAVKTTKSKASSANSSQSQSASKLAETKAAEETAKAKVVTGAKVLADKEIVDKENAAKDKVAATKKSNNKGKDDHFNDFRKGKVYAENEADALRLKRNNVIVASLSKKDGVERLRKVFEKAGEDFLVVRNDKGMYYFVLGSYDERPDAVSKRNVILDEYVKKFSKSQLLKEYGIPFSDMWVLVNEE